MEQELVDPREKTIITCQKTIGQANITVGHFNLDSMCVSGNHIEVGK